MKTICIANVVNGEIHHKATKSSSFKILIHFVIFHLHSTKISEYDKKVTYSDKSLYIIKYISIWNGDVINMAIYYIWVLPPLTTIRKKFRLIEWIIRKKSRLIENSIIRDFSRILIVIFRLRIFPTYCEKSLILISNCYKPIEIKILCNDVHETNLIVLLLKKNIIKLSLPSPSTKNDFDKILTFILIITKMMTEIINHSVEFFASILLYFQCNDK